VRRVPVEIPGQPYSVVVGTGVLGELAELIQSLEATAVAVVTDETVGAAWSAHLDACLAAAQVRTSICTVTPGEGAKTMAGLTQVLDFLERSEIDRQGVVVALGGGTVGDLAGFAAAVWLRGVRFVQVPTTLLAMVDASVGGKTGINTGRAKNAVGAFWQPAAVLADLACLATLPDDEYLAAFAEIVKYAVAMDAALGERLERDRKALLARRTEALEPVVARCVELKAGVVAADEREGGLRAILNYGHTVGHALESASGYAASHGRAVAFGMEAAARIGVAAGLTDASLPARQDALLEAFGLPGSLPRVTADAVLAAIPRDKKRRGDAVRWVLPRAFGSADVGVRVPNEVVTSAIRALLP
jgi:3-dehydroquinate synthase